MVLTTQEFSMSQKKKRMASPPTCVGMPKEMGSVTPNLATPATSMGQLLFFCSGRALMETLNVFQDFVKLIFFVDFGIVLLGGC